MNKIYLEKERLYKLSMGIFFKRPELRNLVSIFEKNNWAVMSLYTTNGQGNNWVKDVNIGDYIYITFGKDKLLHLAQITSDFKELPDDINDIIGDSGYGYREYKIIAKSVINNTTKLKNDKRHWLPSANTTFKEILNLNEANDLLFKPYYNVSFFSNTNSRNNNNNNNNTLNSIKATNQILYGPPGTGKTYATKELVVDKVFGVDKRRNREEVIKLYKKLIDNGQVVFTTFHQSMSYEDFVEGIKPKTQGNDVIYDVEDGVFKLLSDTAKDNWEAYHNNISDKKVAFDDVFNQLKEDWEENNEIQFPMKREGNDFTIIGFTNRSIQFKKASGGTGHTLSIDTLKKGFYNEKTIRSTGVGIYYPSIIDRLKTYEAPKEESTELKSYVLIIDEINRGNVSAIFGELITLLEPDKRLGEKEEITVTLPYSKSENKFGIPPNLHIIGTMNTADRSVEALDTALRRRFEFKEIVPDPSLLKEITFGSFNLEEVLETINNRIELLLDSDHTIGHSYFITIESGDTEKLASVFKNKVIPLLQEYFYGDYGKIGLVLGKGFIQQKENKEVEFADFTYENSNDYKTASFQIQKIDTNNIIKAIHETLGIKKEATPSKEKQVAPELANV